MQFSEKLGTNQSFVAGFFCLTKEGYTALTSSLVNLSFDAGASCFCLFVSWSKSEKFQAGAPAYLGLGSPT